MTDNTSYTYIPTLAPPDFDHAMRQAAYQLKRANGFDATVANNATVEHCENIMSQVTEQYAITVDKIVAMCKLLPRIPKERFQEVMNVVFGIEATEFQATVNHLLEAGVLLEIANYYLIKDQSFAVQAVANFQIKEDMSSVCDKLQAMESGLKVTVEMGSVNTDGERAIEPRDDCSVAPIPKHGFSGS